MQLGARWKVGDPPHPSVPNELHAQIAEQERTHPNAESWTLTWLEGRPRAALDDLLVLGPDGIEGEIADADSESDDWLD